MDAGPSVVGPELALAVGAVGRRDCRWTVVSLSELRPAMLVLGRTLSVRALTTVGNSVAGVGTLSEAQNTVYYCLLLFITVQYR